MTTDAQIDHEAYMQGRRKDIVRNTIRNFGMEIAEEVVDRKIIDDKSIEERLDECMKELEDYIK